MGVDCGTLRAEGSAEAEAWVKPYINGLKNHEDGASEMIGSLKEFQKRIGQFSQKQKAAYERELNYFWTNRCRMDYKPGSDQGQPVGS